MKAKIILFLFTLSLCILALASCFGGPEPQQECEHNWTIGDDYKQDNIDCVSDKVTVYECDKCYERRMELSQGQGHRIVNGECQNCETGLKFELNDDGESYKVTEFYDSMYDRHYIYSYESFDSLDESEKRKFVSEIEIPSEYMGLPVTVIGYECFGGKCALTSVTIPNTVTKIEDSAFANCTLIKSIEIPDSVTEIGNSVFLSNGFTSLNDVKLPSGITTIPEYAFGYCEGLVEIIIPENVEIIEYEAFVGCPNVEKISIPKGIKKINNSFSNCDNINEIYYDAANAEEISFGFYRYSEGLNDITITIGSNVEVIPKYIFSYLDLKSLTFVENSICHTIGEQAFLYCTGLTELNLPSSVTTVEKEAFAQCSDIASLTIGENLQKVGYQAFHGFLSLENVYYNAKNLENENNYVLWGYYEGKFTNAEKSIVLHIGENVEKIAEIFHGVDISKINVPSLAKWFTFESYTPNSTNGLYINGAAITSIVVPDNVTEINVNFGGCKEVKEIIIHNDVTKIADYAFADCPSTETLTIGKSVYSIGELAFADLYNLKTLNYNAESITDYFVHFIIGGPFRDMGKETENGTTIIVGGDVVSFEGHLFYGSTIDTVLVPSIEQIFSGEFSLPDANNGVLINGESISTLVIPESITEISEGAFSGNNIIEKVVFHSGITKIGDSAFEWCENLKTISNLPSGVEIGEYAFHGCSIEKVEIPNDAKLGNSAFASCDITEISLGKNVTLHNNAFAFINTEILILPENTYLSYAAFYGATLDLIKIGEGVTIEEGAFYGATIDEIYCDYKNSTINENAFLYASSKDDGIVITIKDSVDILSKLANLYVNEINLEMNLAEYCQKDFDASVFVTTPNVKINGGEISGDITVPNGVTYIGKNTFYGSSITSVSIPSSVEKIGANAFGACENLEAIIGGENVKECGENAVNYDLVSETLYNGIYYKFNTLSRLESYDIVSIVIREGTKEIPERFFEGCQGLLHVYVPNGCEIGSKAFYNTNTGIRILLENPSYPGGDWRILAETSTGNILIGGVAYVNGVQTQIGSIVNGVSYDAESGFAYYDNYVTGYFGNEKSITVPAALGKESITSIDERAFIGLNIEAINCDAVLDVGEYSFALCTSLASIEMKNATEIGSLAFQCCTKLASVTMEKAVYIRAGAFYGCSALREITIPSTVKYINNLSFYECNGLESVVFVNSTSRWYLEGSAGIIVGVDDPTKNASYLKGTYANYGWIIETEVQ